MLAAAVSDMLPPESRTSGLALLQTAMALALLVSSAMFGALWTWRGVDQALVFVVAGVGTGAGGGRRLAPDGSLRMNRRLLAFGGVVVACVAGVAVYAASASSGVEARAPVSPVAEWQGIQAEPHIIFVNSPANSRGELSIVPLGSPGGRRAILSPDCERVDGSAGPSTTGRGLCLRTRVTGYSMVIFDRDFRTVKTIPLAGAPSRARVSGDGKLAATTVFVSGDGYASNNLSTRTELFDLAQGTSLGNLESFRMLRDGEQIRPSDANLWGVTFVRDDDTFYATLSTGGHKYLVRGSLRARTVQVVTDGVECPSLSPDQTRIAFKKPTGKLGDWRLSVLDLATLHVTPLAETRSIDDQAAWLDNTTVMYGGSRVAAHGWPPVTHGSFPRTAPARRGC